MTHILWLIGLLKIIFCLSRLLFVCKINW